MWMVDRQIKQAGSSLKGAANRTAKGAQKGARKTIRWGALTKCTLELTWRCCFAIYCSCQTRSSKACLLMAA